MSFLRRRAFQLILAIVCLTLALAPKSLLAQPSPVSTQSDSASAQYPPSRQAYQLNPDKLAKAITLSRIRNTLEIAGDLWALVFLWLLLATRAWSGIETWTQRRSTRRWVQGAWFYVAFILLTTLADLPLDLYAHHESLLYSISVQSWPGWFGDQGRTLALGLVVGTPILLLFNWIVRRWPRRYWFGAWLATIPILLIVMFVEPVVIEPLFDKFEPLSESNPVLVAQLERVVARTGTDIPPNRIFLMEASSKTNGLNAYVSGVGATKRIVVWDTTAGRVPNDEVLFLFGHESGHYVLEHIVKGFAVGIVALFFLFRVCAAVGTWAIRRFGAGWGVSDARSRTGFVVLLFVISVASFVAQPISNGASRYFEHQADVFGQEAIHGIVPDPENTAVSAFNHLGEAWLEDPNPSPLIEFWLYNHPSIQHRANFASHYDPWINGGHGEFFAK